MEPCQNRSFPCAAFDHILSRPDCSSHTHDLPKSGSGWASGSESWKKLPRSAFAWLHACNYLLFQKSQGNKRYHPPNILGAGHPITENKPIRVLYIQELTVAGCLDVGGRYLHGQRPSSPSNFTF